MELLVAGVLYTDKLTEAKCYINNDILAVLPPLNVFTEDEKEKQVQELYKSLSTDTIIESSRMRYKLIEELKPIFGVKK